MNEFSWLKFILSYIGILYSIATFLVFLIFGFFPLTVKGDERKILTFRKYILYSVFWFIGIYLFFRDLRKFEEKQTAIDKTGGTIIFPDAPYFETSKNSKKEKGGRDAKPRPYEP